ncbi:hypothetical protein PsYK624_101270 [Phanerochaete sordida]|uniref:DUF6534 domain-containing protein n=1 Tax=Phanerochaete sordida TaxID=48140 RepID=A0A9P3GHV8_9APHY|nr:hypothetical protein PsYK624_101270 [Phanerochaete sordida]
MANIQNATAPLPLLGSLRFDGTLGALFIGEVLISVLFGTATVQAYFFFHCNERDSLLLKAGVFLIWFADAFHLFVISYGIYGYTVTNFMNPLALTQCPWSLASTMFVGELAMVPISLYDCRLGSTSARSDQAILHRIYSHRIYKLSGKKWLLALIIPPQLASGVASIAIGIIILNTPSYVVLQAHYSWLWHTMYGLQTFTDCAIAASLSTLLVRQRSAFRRTNSLIATLVLYAVGTCTLTSSVSLASIIAYVIAPRSFVFLLFGMLLPKLMANSLLAPLNARASLRARHTGGAVSVRLSRLARVAVQGVGEVKQDARMESDEEHRRDAGEYERGSEVGEP